MSKEMVIESYIESVRSLKGLNDSNLSSDEYRAEWKRLSQKRNEAASQLTEQELKAAYERAQFAG